MLLECVDEVFHLLFFSSSNVDKSIKKKIILAKYNIYER